ncbi:MAG: hypothetical protein IH810_05730 [Proteobacteria bacterium]|nr:hypothetical protein [Pseudomonadota bacterium]
MKINIRFFNANVALVARCFFCYCKSLKMAEDCRLPQLSGRPLRAQSSPWRFDSEGQLSR